MTKNIKKGESYHLVISQLKKCTESDDVFHLIGLTAACESIFSDRISAFLSTKKHPEFLEQSSNEDSFTSFENLLKYARKDLKVGLIIPKKTNEKAETKNLYTDLMAWKKNRNNVIHAICKSKSAESHKSVKVITEEAFCSCDNGYRLVRLILKWNLEPLKNKSLKNK